MNRFLYFCSILVLMFFVTGSYVFPNDVIMWFASTANVDNIVRGGLVVVLFMLMIIPPPRSLVFRILLGVVSLCLVGWTASTFYVDQLRVLDALAYALLSVVFCLAALEITYDTGEPRTAAPTPKPHFAAGM